MTEEEIRLGCIEQAQRMSLPGQPLEERLLVFLAFVREDPVKLACIRLSIDGRNAPRMSAESVIDFAVPIFRMVRPLKQRGGRRKRD